MTVYNGAQTIGRALEALVQQDDHDYEILVVDDGSTDTTSSILRQWAAQHARVRVMRTSHVGRAAALNLGLRHCRGRYVAINDCDDVSAPERVRLQGDYLDAHPRVVLVGAWARVLDDTGQDLGVRRTPTLDSVLRQRLAIGNPFVHSSIMYRREALVHIGGFNERRPAGIDYDAIVRLAEIGELACIPQPLVAHYRSSKQYFRAQMARSIRWRAAAGVAVQAAKRYNPCLLPVAVAMYVATYLPIDNALTEWLSELHGRLNARA